MNVWIWIILIAVSILATRLSIYMSYRYGILDEPGAVKIHSTNIPRFGGFGIVTSYVVAIILIRPFEQGFWSLIPILLIAITGMIDDLWTLKPIYKITGQLVAGFALACLGPRIELTHLILLDGLLTIIAVIFFANAINLLDGMDALAGGSAIFMAAGMVLLGWLVGSRPVIDWSLTIIAACLGFLVFNRPPARTFMGDIGSLTLGLSFVMCMGELIHFGAGVGLASLFVLFIPTLDTVLGFLRRVLRGQHPFAGDRDHIYDRIYNRTRNYDLTTVSMYSGNLIAVGCAWLVLRGYWQLAVCILALCVLFIVIKLDILCLQERHRSVHD